MNSNYPQIDYNLLAKTTVDSILNFMDSRDKMYKAVFTQPQH